jgi:hypothetical protein
MPAARMRRQQFFVSSAARRGLLLGSHLLPFTNGTGLICGPERPGQLLSATQRRQFDAAALDTVDQFFVSLSGNEGAWSHAHSVTGSDLRSD